MTLPPRDPATGRFLRHAPPPDPKRPVACPWHRIWFAADLGCPACAEAEVQRVLRERARRQRPFWQRLWTWLRGS